MSAPVEIRVKCYRRAVHRGLCGMSWQAGRSARQDDAMCGSARDLQTTRREPLPGILCKCRLFHLARVRCDEKMEKVTQELRSIVFFVRGFRCLLYFETMRFWLERLDHTTMSGLNPPNSSPERTELPFTNSFSV